MNMTTKAIVISEIMDDIRRVFQVVNDKSKKAERETGITGPQLWAIKIIGDSAPVRVSDLAARMYLNPSTVVGILDRLELRGLIQRMRSNDDRRVVKVQLTEVGKELLVRAPEVASGLLVNGLEGLTFNELKSIEAGLDKLVSILGAQELPPQLILSNEVNVPTSQVEKSKEK
jgi:MarR family transcriptional regulator, organic hydroperoxide resistance regulator